jgi:hypothetical protein
MDGWMGGVVIVIFVSPQPRGACVKRLCNLREQGHGMMVFRFRGSDVTHRLCGHVEWRNGYCTPGYGIHLSAVLILTCTL